MPLHRDDRLRKTRTRDRLDDTQTGLGETETRTLDDRDARIEQRDLERRERRERRRGFDPDQNPDQTDPDITPTDTTPTDTTPGLGGPVADPFSNFETTEDVLARLMGRDSPLMRKAAAQGKQFANRRGLLNSSLAAQASQSALLDQIVPIASQTSDQGFRRGLQESEFSFTGSESQKERDLKLDIVQREEALQREKILSDENISAADRGLRKTIAAESISANDRRGAESMLNNAYRDYESSLASIMSNPELDSGTRNQLLTNAKNMLIAKIDYAEGLYGTVFSWPENPFEGAVSSTSASTTSTSTTTTPSPLQQFLSSNNLPSSFQSRADDSDPG